MTSSVQSVLSQTSEIFTRQGIPNADFDSKWLLASLLEVKPIDLKLNAQRILSPKEIEDFQSYVHRRLKREPLQYILGETEFWGLKIKVSPEVLIPRHETELLVETTIKYIEELAGNVTPPSPLLTQEGELRILDIGTGSGCIAIALARSLPSTKITATEISATALSLAKENAKINGVEDQIQFIETDIYPPKDAPPFDIIVANPPYVAESTWSSLQREIIHYEPKMAVVGGETGLEIVQQVLDHAWKYLKPGGTLLMEIGDDQRTRLEKIMASMPQWKQFDFNLDYHKIDRILIAIRQS